jgi:ABC-2 type transport system permease protein
MKALRLIPLLLQLDFKVYGKYPSRIIFSFFQITLVIFLFYFISETLGDISMIQSQYFPFVATGLAYQYFFSGVVNAASGKLEEYRNYGVLEEILFSRHQPWIVFLSCGFQEVLIASLKAILMITAVLFVFNLKIQLSSLVPVLTLTFVYGLGLSFVASCSFLLWKRFNLLEIGGTVVTLFLSGVYFPVEVLPEPLLTLAQWNPLMHGLRLFRNSLGVSSMLTGSQDYQLSLWILLGAGGLVGVTLMPLYRWTYQKIKRFGISNHF